MTYEVWEKLRQELWEKYKAHYLQAADEIQSANIFVFEHCIIERRLCDKGLGVDGLTDDQKAQIEDIDSHAVSIMDNLYMEASIPLDARPMEVTCRRCRLKNRGFKVYIKLPELGEILHDEFCTTCA